MDNENSQSKTDPFQKGNDTSTEQNRQKSYILQSHSRNFHGSYIKFRGFCGMHLIHEN